jgi:hypothetical protein
VSVQSLKEFHVHRPGNSSSDPRFRKAFQRPSSSLFQLTQAHPNQDIARAGTLTGVGWNELE